ncbi:MAG TPA: SRPBCC family protein [Aquabacterium sp.]|nr:SRPBCC family protein [Aquabacterium sp.]HQC95987.1 SRPBCC family protein [Aquabacterium sp.]
MSDTTTDTAHLHDLTLTRDIAASPAALFRCWTDPALIPQWFCPPPWGVSHAETDVRPGGASLIVMRGPEGQEMPNRGVYLEVVPNRRIVCTDAYVRAWEPSAKPFMTLILSFDDLGDGRTRYTAIARHWSAEDCKAHEDMGFHQGWGIATDQLAALAATL